MFYIILILLNVIIISSGYIVYKRKLKEKINIETKNYIEENKQELKAKAEKEVDYLKRREVETQAAIQRKQKDLENISGQITTATKHLDEVNAILFTQRETAKTHEEELREQSRKAVSSYETDLRKLVEEKAREYEKEKIKLAEAAYADRMTMLGTQAAQMTEQIQSLSNQIEEYSAKQAAINEAIIRQRKLDEQKDFYRVCVEEASLDDISILNTAKRNLKKPEIIDKIIYDNYISKPVLEMVKRVLQNTTCSGIYKITCTKTGEVYIGKSTDVKSRWQQHCKSAFNCGTIAQSLLHTKMKQYGLENFTFELIEQVPKDQLSEREKFYIQFYQTKEVGLNERNG